MGAKVWLDSVKSIISFSFTTELDHNIPKIRLFNKSGNLLFLELFLHDVKIQLLQLWLNYSHINFLCQALDS